MNGKYNLSQQWLNLQSERWEWKCFPDHVLLVYSCQHGTSSPPSGLGPQTLGTGMSPVYLRLTRLFEKLIEHADFHVDKTYLDFLLLCRSVKSTVQRKEGCLHMCLPSWLSSTYRSVKSLSCRLIWTRGCVFFFTFLLGNKYNLKPMFSSVHLLSVGTNLGILLSLD